MKILNIGSLLRLLVFFITYSSGAAFADTYYVAPTGSDSNNGSISSPWGTILYATTQVSPGDMIQLRAGTYNEGERIWIRYSNSGTSAQPCILESYPGEEATIETRFTWEPSFWIIRNLRFVNASVSLVDWSGPSQGVQVVNNRFEGWASNMIIIIGGTNHLIADNHIEINANPSSSTLNHGIYHRYGRGTIIRNNYVAGASGYNIHIFEERKGAGVPQRFIEDVTIEGNFVTASRQRSGIILAADDDVVARNIIVRNNIIYGNQAGSGIVVRRTMRGVKIYHNTIVGNGGDGIQAGYTATGGTAEDIEIFNNIIGNTQAGGAYQINVNPAVAINVSLSNNLYFPGQALNNVSDPSPVVDDPQFVDAANNDYHLQVTSPAIDAGMDLGLSYNGPAPDLGAFELEDIATPVELESFQAFVTGNSVILNWVTASETNNYSFEIERSLNNIQFSKIGFVEGYGTASNSNSYQFVDEELGEGNYYYRLKQVDTDGSFEYTSSVAAFISPPQKFNLQQNYPNPFNPETRIVYEILTPSRITLKIYDLTGKKLITLTDQQQSPGYYTLNWNGKNAEGQNVASGIYFYKLEASAKGAVVYTQSKKMILTH